MPFSHGKKRPKNVGNKGKIIPNNKQKINKSKRTNKVCSICIGMNIQGINPSINSKSGWKLPRLKEEITSIYDKQYNIPFIAIVETWLKPEITEAQICVKGFNTFRCDRDQKQHGGVLLYINDKLVIDRYEMFNDDQCAAIICLSSLSKCIFCCLYRPPTADLSSFCDVLNFIETFMSLNNSLSKFQLFLFGDFNLPKYCWKDLDTFSCTSNESCYIQFNTFMEKLLLSQYVTCNTRQNNVLDLFLTNDLNFVKFVQSVDIYISDHLMIQIFTDFFRNLSTESSCFVDSIDCDFSNFDLNKANFNEINEDLLKINWNSIISNNSVEEFPDEFKHLVFSSVKKNCPVKRIRTLNFLNSYKKDRKIMARKIRRHNKQILRLKRLGNTAKIDKFEKKIEKLLENQKQSFFDEKHDEEFKAISKIKVDPKYFF